MGDITLISAVYTVGSHDIVLLNEMKEELAKNYGELNIVVSALDAKLRKDNRITVPVNDSSLAQHVPVLTIKYVDREGAWHIATGKLTDTVKIGERSVFGKMVQKPGEILWSSSLVVGQWMMVFVVVTMWALVVLWSWMQTRGMEGKFTDWSTLTTARFGPIGFVIAVVIYVLFYIVRIPGELIGNLMSEKPPDGWLLKPFVAAASGYAPIPGFLVQTIIWMTVVRNLGKPAGPTMADNASGAVDAATAAAALGSKGAAGLLNRLH
jgi:hypothetical protein